MKILKYILPALLASQAVALTPITVRRGAYGILLNKNKNKNKNKGWQGESKSIKEDLRNIYVVILMIYLLKTNQYSIDTVTP